MTTTASTLEPFLERCSDLASIEEYRHFLDELESATGYTDNHAIRERHDDSDLRQRALAFLTLTVQGEPPAAEDFEAALALDHRELLPAAALCFSRRGGENDVLLRELLLGPSSFEPSIASFDGRYHLIRFLGFSGDSRFGDVLAEALVEHSHFCPPTTVATALEQLGQGVSEEQLPYKKSITVTESGGDILIHTDDRFSGTSNCVGSQHRCPFFPCRINEYFPRAIEDCKSWNRTDPSTLGEIRDYRKTWGHHLNQVDHAAAAARREAVKTSRDSLEAAEREMEAGRALTAIPKLAAAIVDSPEEIPVAWVWLARSVEAAGEKRLAFLLRRAAWERRKITESTNRDEVAEIDSFSNDPSELLAGSVERDDAYEDTLSRPLYRRATSYSKASFPTTAFDICVLESLHQSETPASHWYEIGLCHEALGEPHLAELFMRHAALKTTEKLGNRQRFEQHADEVRQGLPYQEDPGLTLDRRAYERRLTSLAVLEDETLAARRGNDPQAETAYWLVVTEDASPEQIVMAVLARLRWSREGFLIDMAEEVRSRLFYLLNAHARSVFQRETGASYPEIKRTEIGEIVARGLAERDRHQDAAALFAVKHDLSHAEVRFSASKKAEKAPYLAWLRFTTAVHLLASDTPFADNVTEIFSIAEGASALLDDHPGTQNMSREDIAAMRDHIVAWIDEVSSSR